jgi:hypothetical protein
MADDQEGDSSHHVRRPPSERLSSDQRAGSEDAWDDQTRHGEKASAQLATEERSP